MLSLNLKCVQRIGIRTEADLGALHCYGTQTLTQATTLKITTI